ncbi:MAG: ATP-binding protein [Candidatus Verstraetearchaeota archaeon]|nr:ATP-binding protein [Candidatus Verstraetearchaeota archaeon]
MLTGNNKVRDDVFDIALDEKLAPSLGGVVLGKEHEMYINSEKFFERTLITDQIANILLNILNVLKGESGRKILVLSALYGGGKTHTLLAIYHALKAPYSLLKAKAENNDVKNRINKFIEEISKIKTDIVVVDGYYSELSPSPIEPLDVRAYKIYTLWGYIAHALGSYNILGEDDEKQISPSADKILKILENKNVVILIDEIAHYIKRFYGTPDENLRRYASAIETFIEALAKAIDLVRNSILVISLPAEKKEEEVKVEITYQAIKQSIERIFKSLGRIHTEYIEPIAPRNIPALLRTRLFEEIDERRARDVHDILYKTYEENKEIFGAQVTLVGEVLNTYPFHPLYIDTLIDILDKHEYLQKTRDLLRISRNVLREVLCENKPYDLIMPWHIDLTKDSIRHILLKGEYEGFNLVINDDINSKTGLYSEKSLLAKIIAIALLTRTFVYGGGFVVKVEAFPSEKDLALMVYEPAIFQVERWAPKDIVDALKWIIGNLLYVVRDEKTGRLWFTKYTTPVKYVEEYARKIDDMLAINKIKEYADKLLRETADVIIRRRTTKVKPEIFDAELSQVNIICEPIDIDTRRYILLAYLNTPEKEKIEEILYRTKSGGIRKYANTIYVIFPSTHERIRLALDSAKKLIACDELERGKIVEKMTENLPSEEAEIAREVLRRKLEEYKTGVLGSLIRNILAIFDKIAYPYYDEKRLANTFKEEDFVVQADSIIVAVERSLSSPGIGKLKKEIDYDILDFYLREIKIDLSDGHEPKTIGTIIDYFYSNPKLPAVPKSAIIDAIKDGVKKLRIGVKSKGRIYFKKIYEAEAPQISEGEIVEIQDDNDEVLPWRIALQEQMKILKKREFIEGKERKIEEYIIKIGGKDIAVEEILNNIEKYDLELLRVAPIVKVIKTISIKLEPIKSLIEVKPNEKISIEVYVSRIGPYTGEILLKPSIGKLNKQRLIIDNAFTKEKITWIIDEIPQQTGEYSYTLDAINSQGVILDTARVTIKVIGKGPPWIEGIPSFGAKIEVLELSNKEKFSIKPLDILKRKLSGVAIVSEANFIMRMKTENGKESSIELNINNVQIDDILTIITAIISRFQLLKSSITLNLVLKPTKGDFFIMPEIKEDEKKVLEEYKIKYLERIIR